jgi:Tfp pilus assembly protein PilO
METLNRLAWHAGRMAQGAGMPGLLGAALLAAAVLLAVFGLGGERDRQAALEARRTAALASMERKEAGIADTRALTHEGFYAALPGADAIPGVLRDLEHAARARGLDFDEAQYQWSREAKGSLARYRITLPLSGGYRAVRGFLADVLGRHPALALDDIKLEREAIGGAQVEANVRLTLFVNVNVASAARESPLALGERGRGRGNGP